MRHERHESIWLLLAVTLAVADARGAESALRAERVADGLEQPVFVTAPPGDSRLFVVLRGGEIRVLDEAKHSSKLFLDVSSRVSTLGEGGLLGLAFDPDYPAVPHFYVYYTRGETNPKNGLPYLVSVLSRFSVSDDPDVANPAEEILLEYDQPHPNHNGGTVAFHPASHLLYLGLGDGGGGYDPGERAQNGAVLNGKLLRVDVRHGPGKGKPYRIPADNPRSIGGSPVRPEVWAKGLRNPYRFSFDRETGDLWIGDVGQTTREEIDFAPNDSPGGLNFGWDVMEGSTCVELDPAPAPPCNDPSFTGPVYEYAQTDGPCPGASGSVTGGYVYRGAIPEIRGLYFFADYCRSQIWTFDRRTGGVVERTRELAPETQGDPSIDLIVGFGEDGFGELLVVDISGEIFRIRARSTEPATNGP